MLKALSNEEKLARFLELLTKREKNGLTLSEAWEFKAISEEIVLVKDSIMIRENE